LPPGARASCGYINAARSRQVTNRVIDVGRKTRLANRRRTRQIGERLKQAWQVSYPQRRDP
jgi:hypothetical protein